MVLNPYPNQKPNPNKKPNVRPLEVKLMLEFNKSSAIDIDKGNSTKTHNHETIETVVKTENNETNKIGLTEPKFWSKPLIGHIAITSVLVLLITVGVIFLYSLGNYQTQKWLLPPTETVAYTETIPDAAPLEQERIGAQIQEIQARDQRHFKMMTFFYNNYYMSKLMTYGTAIVAGICLLFIIRSGWNSTHPYVINIFVVVSASAILFGNLPGLFRYEDSIVNNKQLYLNYASLKNEVSSYLVTGQDIDGNPIEMKYFINHIDKELSRLNRLPIGFERTRLLDYPTLYSSSQFDKGL
ncbi:hypothetical protein BJP34_16000 [Moorena producens PAL-8-15-08-1]|uniref:Uncharacterized protein n=1 Tax=Moorena producens PAL-8-15-08-1 TaxID=1458985 RepID=A0A1D8TT47_9CYAN|nr:hypothetical protein [Moorena producens]AOX00745.1 hypothetical protein BJP34_16000 [Moorena producens PAL-8-15-08-1]